MGKVSFMPDALVEGGGLWNNVDVRFTNCRFESAWTAGGKRTASPAFVSDLIMIDDESTVEAGWSLGSSKNYKASKDGVKEAPDGVGDYVVGAEATKTANYVIMVLSLIAAMPEAAKQEAIDKIIKDGAASAWNGLEAHVIRQTIEREGLTKKKNEAGKEMEFTVPVIDSILKYPWDKKAAPGTKAAAGKATGAGKPAGGVAAAAPSLDLDQKAREKVVEVLTAAGAAMIRKDLAQEAFKKTTDPKMKQPLAKLIYEKVWVMANAEAGGWVYDEDADTLALKEVEEEFIPGE